MDGETHMLVGGLAGFFLPEILANSQIRTDVDIISRLRYGMLGAFGGKLPDIMEPPSNPQHRDFFHSITAGTSLLYATNKGINHKVRPELMALCVGYLSHLLADSLTESGLPLI